MTPDSHAGGRTSRAFRAFNRWLDDDWGLHYEDRIFGAPYITLVDLDWAVEELEWALERGVRVIVMRSAPVGLGSQSRSPSDPVRTVRHAEL